MTPRLPKGVATAMAAAAGLTAAVGTAPDEASAKAPPSLDKASLNIERAPASLRLPRFEGCQACTSGLDVFVIQSPVLEQIRTNRLRP